MRVQPPEVWGGRYKKPQNSPKPHFLQDQCNNKQPAAVHSDTPTTYHHLLCSVQSQVSANQAGGELSRSTEILRLHRGHYRKRRKQLSLDSMRRQLRHSGGVEMESVTVGRRGRRERERRGVWKGARRVDPVWLKRLRLKLQQKSDMDTIPTPLNNCESLSTLQPHIMLVSQACHCGSPIKKL